VLEPVTKRQPETEELETSSFLSADRQEAVTWLSHNWKEAP